MLFGLGDEHSVRVRVDVDDGEALKRLEGVESRLSELDGRTASVRLEFHEVLVPGDSNLVAPDMVHRMAVQEGTEAVRDPYDVPPGPDGIVEGSVREADLDTEKITEGFGLSREAGQELRKVVGALPGDLGRAGRAAQGFAMTFKTALASTGVGAFVVVLGTVVTALIGMATLTSRLGREYKALDAQLASVSLTYDDLERGARQTAFAVTSIDQGRQLMFAFANSAEEAQYQLSNFGQVDTTQLIAANKLGLSLQETMDLGQEGVGAVAARLSELGVENTPETTRYIHDAFGVSLDQAGLANIIANGTEQEKADALKMAEELQLLGDQERDAASKAHTTMLQLQQDVSNKLVPLTDTILTTIDNLLSWFTGEESLQEREERMDQAKSNVYGRLAQGGHGLTSQNTDLDMRIQTEFDRLGAKEDATEVGGVDGALDFASAPGAVILERTIDYSKAVLENPVLQDTVSEWFDTNIVNPVTNFFEQPVIQNMAVPEVGPMLMGGQGGPQSVIINNEITYQIDGGSDVAGIMRASEENTNRMLRAQDDGP